MPLTVWTNVSLTPKESAWLAAEIAPHVLVVAEGTASNLVSGGPDPRCQSANIAFGQPAVEDLLESVTLRWTHLTSAGYTRYDRDDLRESLAQRGATLTNSSSVYDDPCAHHVLAFMLEHSRHLHGALDLQRQANWAYADMRARQRVLTGQAAVIVGYGAIGRRLAELLAPFGMSLVGIKRSVSGTEAIPCFPIGEIADHLGNADHVVNLLPASPSTERLFGSSLFAKFRPGAAFYNVGRGDTVVQEDLLAALGSGQVGAAYLDVTSPEPLPAEHPLWSTPNVVITPHVAGGVQDESQRLLDHFVANFRRFVGGEALRDRVL